MNSNYHSLEPLQKLGGTFLIHHLQRIRPTTSALNIANMSFNSEPSPTSSQQEKLLPWMVNKLLAKTKRNRLMQDNQHSEEGKQRYRSPTSPTKDLPQIEHRRDEDGGNALRINMNTKLQATTYASTSAEPERIRKISPSTNLIPRKAIATYVPTGAERVVSAERQKEEFRSAKKIFQPPPKNTAPVQDRQLRSAGITERNSVRPPRDLSPRRNLPRKEVPRQREKPTSPSSSRKVQNPEPSFLIPRKPRHIPRLPSVDEGPQLSANQAQHTIDKKSPPLTSESHDATEWGFVTQEPTSFLESPSESEYSETSDGLDGLPDEYIEQILAKHGAIGRGATRSESEYSQTTDGKPNDMIDKLPERDNVIGLGVYEDRSESEYSHSEAEQPVEDWRWKSTLALDSPAMTRASGSVYVEDEAERLERWQRYFDTNSTRRLVEEEVEEEDPLFEQLLREVQIDPNEPGYRSEAEKRKYWEDIRKGLKIDSPDDSSEEKDIKVPESPLDSPPEVRRRRRAQEQHDNRRETIYQAKTQRNTERNEARDTIGSEADLWELETLLKNLQKKRNRGDGVVEEEKQAEMEEKVISPKRYPTTWPSIKHNAKSPSTTSPQAPSSSSSPPTHPPWTLSRRETTPSHVPTLRGRANTAETSPSMLPPSPLRMLYRHASMSSSHKS